MTDTSPSDPDREQRFAEVLGEALQHAAKEPVLLARLEEYFSPKPAQLAETSEEESRLNAQIERVVQVYGGAPRLIIHVPNEPKPMYDMYMNSALIEVTAMFHRARRSVCRAQTFMIGAHMAGSTHDLLAPEVNEEIRSAIQRSANAAFWEHIETSFIRIASFWDRVGQVLDFCFFSIRQYERDGFSAVMDRIHANVLRMNPDYSVYEPWQELWNYKRSEREDGLQWLLSRRNLLVHSLHLRPLTSDETDEMFESAFNHIDSRLKRNLATGTPLKELERVHAHLNRAAQLFPQVLRLCEHHANRDRAFG